MKNWKSAEIEVLDVKSTAMGPQNRHSPDGEQYEAVKEDGTKGWFQDWGNNGASAGEQ